MSEELRPEQLEMQRINEAFIRIFNTSDGQVVLNYLVEEFGYDFASTYETTSLGMAIKEGQRSVIARIRYLLLTHDFAVEVENQTST